MDHTTRQAIKAGVHVFAAVALAVVVLAGIVTMSCPATAQQVAAPRAEVMQILGAQYEEAPVAMGLAESGAVIEVFATTDGTHWTIVVTTPDGLSRVVAIGESWTNVTHVAGLPI
jgi:hypothetical protein